MRRATPNPKPDLGFPSSSSSPVRLDEIRSPPSQPLYPTFQIFGNDGWYTDFLAYGFWVLDNEDPLDLGPEFASPVARKPIHPDDGSGWAPAVGVVPGGILPSPRKPPVPDSNVDASSLPSFDLGIDDDSLAPDLKPQVVPDYGDCWMPLFDLGIDFDSPSSAGHPPFDVSSNCCANHPPIDSSPVSSAEQPVVVPDSEDEGVLPMVVSDSEDEGSGYAIVH